MYTYSGFLDEYIIEYAIDPTYLDVESVIPLGLICNELISNAFKHANRNTPEPYLLIKLQSFDKHYLFEVSDNGSGIPKVSALKNLWLRPGKFTGKAVERKLKF